MNKLLITIYAITILVGVPLAIDGSGYHDVPAEDEPLTSSITEDSPSWSCVTMGNRICGPDNDEGVLAGCYDDGGVRVAPWPCHVETNTDGEGSIYQDRIV